MMKRLLTLCAVCLLLANLSFATPPAVFFYFEDGVLTDNGLEKGTPLPDSTLVKIYWDANGNGPDDKDPMPVVGPEFRNANINSFYMNGQAEYGEPGKFASSTGFGTVGDIASPPRYYLKICLDDKSLISDVYTVVPGLQDVFVKEWTIGPACK